MKYLEAEYEVFFETRGLTVDYVMPYAGGPYSSYEEAVRIADGLKADGFKKVKITTK